MKRVLRFVATLMGESMVQNKNFTRRKFVAATAVGAAAPAAVAHTTYGAPQRIIPQVGKFMQEATPEAQVYSGPPSDLVLDGSDWPVPQGDHKGHRVATATTISAKNIDTLGPSWRLDAVDDEGAATAMTGTPIVVGDTTYYSDMNSNIYATDRETSELRWSRMFNFPTNGPNGVAFGHGKIFSGLGESGNVVALDAATGEDVWRVSLTNMKEEGIRMAPIVYGGFVYISIVPLSTNDRPGSRGILHALDVETGNTVWYFDLAEENLWGNARLNMGAGLWYPPTFDDEGNIYFANGNAAPWPGTAEFPSASSRPGPNLYASTAMSIDPTTASVRWYFQPKPHDLFDLDYQIAPVIANIDINGVPTKVAICSGKTGDVVAINADEGHIIWWTKVGPHLNDQLQQLPEHAIPVIPGGNGGVLTAPAFADNVFYCVTTNRPTWHSATAPDFTHQDPFEGEVYAIDATNGDVLWKVDLPTFPTGSIVVANDLVITAGLDGVVRAFTRADGTQVWNFQMRAGVNAPVVVAGDDLIVSAGTMLIPFEGQFEGEPPEAVFEIVKFNLGVGGGTVPEPVIDFTPLYRQDGEIYVKEVMQGSSSTPVAENASPVAGEGTSDQPTAENGAFSLSMVDIAFEPNAFQIPADTDVVITITNNGVLQHDFSIESEGINSGMVPSGEAVELTVNMPAGKYDFICTVEGHAEAGMIGTLTVA